MKFTFGGAGGLTHSEKKDIGSKVEKGGPSTGRSLLKTSVELLDRPEQHCKFSFSSYRFNRD